MWEVKQLTEEWQDSTPESICASVAKMFGVKKTEIALLETSGTQLRFLHPPELQNAGAIPLSSSSIAARTVRTKRADIFNRFSQVKHSSIFEVVKLGQTGLETEVIQKLMSAPILDQSGTVIGVIQVSRKAQSPATAGPDFTPEDLQQLKAAAASLGKLMDKGKA
jgi:GAF domain